MSTSQLASFSVGTAGSLTATALAMAGLGPIGAIVGAGTMLISMIISQFHGCGQTCILTSQAADQIEGQIKQMFAAYMASGHTKSEQAAYLQFFDQAFQKLAQYCGSGSFGKAGVNCVADRQAGACKWKASAGGWSQEAGTWKYTPAGASGSGDTCWNWFVGYRSPVADDPTVVPDTPEVTAMAQALGISSSTNLMPLLLIGGLILVGVML